ncbi:MAG: hypothetical protein GEV09_00575 [Pseudonocardiaceae bacterium]|nr:hypothetical protein [Pseudonocardiaceae bacterium]
MIVALAAHDIAAVYRGLAERGISQHHIARRRLSDGFRVTAGGVNPTPKLRFRQLRRGDPAPGVGHRFEVQSSIPRPPQPAQ